MLVVGAGGFAKQLLDVLEQMGETRDLCFYDDTLPGAAGKLYGQFPILQTTAEVEAYFSKVSRRFALGIGHPELRRLFCQRFSDLGGEVQTVISPLARVAHHDCQVGTGSCILTGCIIENGVQIGKGCLINLGCTITHDTRIGNFSELSPGVRVSGACSIGALCFVGSGAVLLPRISIGDGATIGAGSVVNRSVPAGQTVVGVPAKPVKKK